jgi:hypothetical protein
MTKLTQRQQDKLIEAAQNAIAFAVVGSGEFPFDMLRYDKCWPASQADSGRMPDPALVGVLGRQRRIEMHGLVKPTAGRWRSFGWTVIEDER